jgi:hypothetical protein
VSFDTSRKTIDTFVEELHVVMSGTIKVAVAENKVLDELSTLSPDFCRVWLIKGDEGLGHFWRSRRLLKKEQVTATTFGQEVEAALELGDV